MALVLHLKYAENLRGRTDRLAKVSFRGELKFFILIGHMVFVLERKREGRKFCLGPNGVSRLFMEGEAS